MTNRFLAMAALLAGCNSFTTIDEACLEENPGTGIITEDPDLEVFGRLNCYRRIANAPKVQANEELQTAVEAHRDYLELNTPQLSLRQQRADFAGFTGATAQDRLDAAGYTFDNNTSLLELTTVFSGDVAAQFNGVDHIDFWFADPFIRPGFLQPNLAAGGVAIADYTVVSEDPEIRDVPVSMAYYNLVYRFLSPPVAEAPKAYPRNGQLDAPGAYVHLSDGDALEFGRTYGYPITFTVGSRETGLVVDQFNLRGPNGGVPAQLLTGEDAIGSVGLSNTAIIVPDNPMTVGAEYTAFVQLVTDQGIRRARTTFTIGADNRPLPAGVLSRMAPEDLPVIQARMIDPAAAAKP